MSVNNRILAQMWRLAVVDSNNNPIGVKNTIAASGLPADTTPTVSAWPAIYINTATNVIYYTAVGPTAVWTTATDLNGVTGPASSVDKRIAIFDGVTGKKIKDGGQVVPNGTIGYLDIPQNLQNGAYTLTIDDAGKHIFRTGGSGNITIPSNGAVAFPIGTAVSFINLSSVGMGIACGDSLVQAGAGSTGTRTLAQYGSATAVKTGTTQWFITGVNLT